MRFEKGVTMNKQTILFLSQADLYRAGVLDYRRAVEIAEKAIVDYSKGKILFPDKISQVFDQETQNRINCLPATLTEEKVCGVKWISVFPPNPKLNGLNNTNAVMILSSIVDGTNLAFMDGNVCSNLRTATINAVAAKYLSVPDPETIGFVGAGTQARSAFCAIKSLYPSIKTCFIASRTAATEQDFADCFAEKYPDVDFVCCEADYQKAVENSQIIVSAISGQSPIIKADWIPDGALYLHTGGWEDEYAVPLKANKIVCDQWHAVKHRSQTLSRMYQEELLHDEDIYCDLDKLITGKRPGRENGKEFIYFNAVGLSYVDVALAYDAYKTCVEQGIGTQLNIHTEDNLYY